MPGLDSRGIEEDRLADFQRRIRPGQELDEDAPAVGMPHADHIAQPQRGGEPFHKIRIIVERPGAGRLLRSAEAGQIGDDDAETVG